MKFIGIVNENCCVCTIDMLCHYVFIYYVDYNVTEVEWLFSVIKILFNVFVFISSNKIKSNPTHFHGTLYLSYEENYVNQKFY